MQNLIAVSIVAATVTTGCGLSASQVRDRNLCYHRADAAAQARVDAECPESFLKCSAADPIMAELRAAQEECK